MVKANINTSNEQVDIRKLFIMSLVAGAILILISQFLGSKIIPVPLPDWVKWTLTVSLPTLVIIIYAIVGYRIDTVKPIIERFADTVYYMGFLFTLIALVASMLPFGGLSLDTKQLIRNFSLAVITTIFGLAIRITIVNFQADEQSTRRHLSEELRNAASELISQSRQISTRLEVLNTEIHDTITKSLEESKKSIEKSTQSIDEYAHITKERLLKHINQSSESIVDTINELNNRIRNIDVPPDLLANKLSEPISLFAEKMHETGVILQQLSEYQKSVRDSSRNIANSLERATLKVDKLHQTLDEFNNSLLQDLQSKRELAQLTEKNLHELANTIAEIKGGISHFSEIGAQLNDTSQKLAAFSNVITYQTQSVSDTGNLLKSHLETLRTHQIELDNIINESRKSLAEVSHHLVQAVNYVTDRLGK